MSSSSALVTCHVWEKILMEVELSREDIEYQQFRLHFKSLEMVLLLAFISSPVQLSIDYPLGFDVVRLMDREKASGSERRTL